MTCLCLVSNLYFCNYNFTEFFNNVTRDAPYDDPFSYFGAVIRGEITVTADDLYGLVNNIIVVEILDAARESARTGQRIQLS